MRVKRCGSGASGYGIGGGFLPSLELMFYPRLYSRKASTTHGPLPRGWFYFAMERTGQASAACPSAVTYRGVWLPCPRLWCIRVPNGEVWRAPAENPLGGRPLHPVGAAVVNRKQSAVYKCSRGGSGIRRRMRPVPRPEGAGREPPNEGLGLSEWVAPQQAAHAKRQEGSS